MDCRQIVCVFSLALSLFSASAAGEYMPLALASYIAKLFLRVPALVAHALTPCDGSSASKSVMTRTRPANRLRTRMIWLIRLRRFLAVRYRFHTRDADRLH